MKNIEIGGMEQLFCEIVEKGDEDLFFSRSRAGIFSPALVMWLEISSRVAGRKSLVSALASLGEGEANEVCERNEASKPLRIGKISANTGGLCRARQRLSLDSVEFLCRLISNELLKESGKDALWNGHRVYLMDGTIIALAQSKKTFAKYTPVTNQNGTCKTGQLICTCVHDLFTGIALSPAFGSYTGDNAIGETRLGKAMIQRLDTPGVIVADRAFGIFSTAWTAKVHHHEVLLRLSSQRVISILGRKIAASSDLDEEVVWEARSLQNHPEIPQGSSVRGRVIQKVIRRKGFRPLTLTFFTTLRESAEEIVSLYQRRERIENDIRSLKYTLEMEMLTAKSPDVLEKELLLGFAANNLMRAVLSRAAKKLKIPARKISFTCGLLITKAYGNQLRDAIDPRQRKALVERFLTGLYQTRLPNRKEARIEPRKVVRHPKKFPYMRKSREEERKEALRVAQEHGHRGFFTTVTRKS